MCEACWLEAPSQSRSYRSKVMAPSLTFAGVRGVQKHADEDAVMKEQCAYDPLT